MPVTNCIFLPLLDCISWFPVRRIIDLIACLELISQIIFHADYHLFWLDFGNYRRKASPGKLQHEFVKVKLLIFSETFRQKQFYGSFCCFHRFCCFLAVLLSYYSRKFGKVEIFRIFRDKLFTGREFFGCNFRKRRLICFNRPLSCSKECREQFPEDALQSKSFSTFRARSNLWFP